MDEKTQELIEKRKEIRKVESISMEQLLKEHRVIEVVKPFLKEIIGMNVYDRDFFECFIQVGKERKLISKEKYDLLMEVLI